MKSDESETLCKQEEAPLSEELFRLVAAAICAKERLINSPKPIQDRFI